MAFTTQIKRGMYIRYKDAPYLIILAQFSRQGRVSAFTRTKLKNLFDGKVISVTFDSGTKVEEIDVSTMTMQYVYRDENFAYVMDKETFIQHSIDLENVSDVLNYIKEGDDCIVKFYEEKPISIDARPKVELEVTRTISAVKGNTSSNAMKKATVETGFELDVPLFVSEGDRIIINTELGSYVSKA